MPTWVKTADAKQAFREIIRETIGPAGDNGIVSERETRFANDWLRKLARSMPQPGLQTEDLVDSAVNQAMVAWERFNPPGHGVDSKYLSQREIQQVSAENEALGTLTIRAYERVARPGQVARPMIDAAKRSFEAKPLDRALGTAWESVDFSRWKPAIRESAQYYLSKFDDSQVTKMTAGVPFRDTLFWAQAVIAIDDEGKGCLELFDDDGRPIATAAIEDNYATQWDDSFGDVRATI